MAVGDERLCDTVYSDSFIRTRYSDDEDSVPRGDNAVLRVFNNTERRRDGYELYTVRREVFHNRTTGIQMERRIAYVSDNIGKVLSAEKTKSLDFIGVNRYNLIKR